RVVDAIQTMAGEVPKSYLPAVREAHLLESVVLVVLIANHTEPKIADAPGQELAGPVRIDQLVLTELTGCRERGDQLAALCEHKHMLRSAGGGNPEHIVVSVHAPGERFTVLARHAIGAHTAFVITKGEDVEGLVVDGCAALG